MHKDPLRIVFMGTPEFSVPSLRALAAHPDLVNIVSVYTQPDRPAGRGMKLTPPPVKIVAQELGYAVRQPENVNRGDEPRLLADDMADLFVVVAYAQFLGRAVLNTPRLGCINVHSSLLPKYRGAAPIQFAVLNGETQSGVTTMRLVQKMDAGPILMQKSVPVGAEMTAGQLHDLLSEVGAELLIETIKAYREDRIIETEQDESQVTYASLITKEMGRINWTKTAREVLNHIRGMHPWPCAFAMTNRGLLKVHKAKLLQNSGVQGAVGSFDWSSGVLKARCADQWIELEVVQLEGKKPMAAQELLNGIQSGHALQLEEFHEQS